MLRSLPHLNSWRPAARRFVFYAERTHWHFNNAKLHTLPSFTRWLWITSFSKSTRVELHRHLLRLSRLPRLPKPASRMPPLVPSTRYIWYMFDSVFCLYWPSAIINALFLFRLNHIPLYFFVAGERACYQWQDLLHQLRCCLARPLPGTGTNMYCSPLIVYFTYLSYILCLSRWSQPCIRTEQVSDHFCRENAVELMLESETQITQVQ